MHHLIRNLAVAAIFATFAGTARADLIINGGFETGNLSGWTTSQGTSTVLDEFVTTVHPHSGNFTAALGNVGGLGVLSQTVTGLTVGSEYTLSVWLASDGDTPNRAAVQFGSDVLANQANVPAFNYRNFTYTVTATATSELLQFGTRNDLGFFLLDDVSLTPLTSVPEPSGVLLAVVGAVASLGMVARRRRNAARGS